MRGRTGLWVLSAAIVVACGAVPAVWSRATVEPGGAKREFLIKARQYAYDPPTFTVNRGDEVHIRLKSLDVIHGFYLEGYDLDAVIEPGKSGFKLRRPSEEKEYTPAEEIVFTADKPGKYRYRCSQTCGFLHPFMQGEMIVRPNTLFPAAVGVVVGILLAGLVLAMFPGAGARRPSEAVPAEGV